jgi:hypothetical protein
MKIKFKCCQKNHRTIIKSQSVCQKPIFQIPGLATTQFSKQKHSMHSGRLLQLCCSNEEIRAVIIPLWPLSYTKLRSSRLLIGLYA